MKTTVEISCKQLSSARFTVPVGISPAEILERFSVTDNRYIGVVINNIYKDFSYAIHKDSFLEFFGLDTFEGERMYRRTLTFVLNMAIKKSIENASLKVHYPMPYGFFFTIENGYDMVDYSDIIRREMKQIVEQKLPIANLQVHNADAERIYREMGEMDKVELMETRRNLFYNLNECEGVYGYYYGILAHSTDYIKEFDVKKFREGYIAYSPYTNLSTGIFPTVKNNHLYDMIREQKRLADNIDVASVSRLNLKNNAVKEIIKIGETMQTRLFSRVADNFVERFMAGARIVLISGPSSSGKTTFSYRFRIQLRTFGIHPRILSMDDYFINREDIPVESDGERDFERFENVDHELFTQHLNQLLSGEEIDVPRYDFGRGERYYDGRKMSLKDNGIVVIEGIHALNPRLVEHIRPEKLYKIYLSPLTPISMDNQTYFSTDDLRLIRRIIRDNAYRSYSATNTLKRWPSVRGGERKHIFPYQDQADFYFNTSLLYELGVLKPYIVKLLVEVPNSESVYAEAQRLLQLLDFITPIDDQWIPTDSVLREFIGGSSFDY